MCLPAAAAAPALLATSVGSSVLGFVGQSQAASAEQAYQNSRYAATTEAALDSYVNQLRLGQERIAQEEARAGNQSIENAREGSRAEGSAVVASAAGGVGGVTASELTREFRMIEAENENAIRTNLEWTRDQIGEQFVALQSGAQSRISAAAPRPVAQPSPLALALDIGGSLLANQSRAINNTPDGDALPNTFDAFVGLF